MVGKTRWSYTAGGRPPLPQQTASGPPLNKTVSVDCQGECIVATLIYPAFCRDVTPPKTIWNLEQVLLCRDEWIKDNKSQLIVCTKMSLLTYIREISQRILMKYAKGLDHHRNKFATMSITEMLFCNRFPAQINYTSARKHRIYTAHLVLWSFFYLLVLEKNYY